MTQFLLYTTLSLNVITILSFIYHLAVTHFKIRLMWTEFARRHGLNGGAPRSFYAVGTHAGEEALRAFTDKQNSG